MIKVTMQRWMCLTACGCVLFSTTAPRAAESNLILASQAAALVQQQTEAQTSAEAAPVAAISWQPDHDKAVELARAGHTDEALKILHQLYDAHSDGARITQDYLLVSNWARHDADVIRLYASIEKNNQPDFVLIAAARSYRNKRQYEKALAVYRRGRTQYPDNPQFAAGEIRTLADLNRHKQALELAENDRREHGNRLDVLLAAADAAERGKKYFDALSYYEHAADIDPKNRAAIRGVTLMTNRVGATQLANEKLHKNRKSFTGEEGRRLEGDEAASMVGWGTLEPPSEAKRFAATDKAIARLDALIDRWTRAGFSARNDVLRARFDRLVALRNRMRMREVVEEYQKLLSENVDVPPYALSSVAEAYLYLRAPEKARDLYLKVLETQPDNFDVQSQLFFAYVECDDFEHAYALIDRLDSAQPLWMPLRGSAIPLPNPNRQKADLYAADARLFGGELENAQQRFETIAGAAPYDPRNQYGLGNIYLARGLPRLARMHYEIGKNIEQGREPNNETGVAQADLDLQHFPANESATNNLVQRFPEQLQVQRADRLMAVHNMAELQVKAGYSFPPDGSSVNGNGYDIETLLYSPPIHYNWRIFAGGGFAQGHEPNNEGSIGYTRALAGIEYRKDGITVDLAPTYNLYHGDGRMGAEGNLSWALNDQWTVFGSGALFSRDTPLRALNAGVTADEIKFGGEWRENESRSDRLTATVMPFSDGNTQYGLTNNYMQRLYVDPHFTIDGLFDLSASESTADENRRYYNPKSDLLGLIGARGTQILYHRYETLYQHSLTLMPGAYWEQSFGTDGAFSVRYEHRLLMNDVFNAGVGVNYMHRPYDGVSENDVSLSLDLTQRF